MGRRPGRGPPGGRGTAGLLPASGARRRAECRGGVRGGDTVGVQSKVGRDSVGACALVGLAGVTAEVVGVRGVSASFVTATSTVAHGVSAKSCFRRATVQSGTLTSTANGSVTATITAVDDTKAFLLFSTSSNLNRPPGSEVKGRLASATSVEFSRVTDETVPATITITWDVVEYNCGVAVQRGVVTPAGTTTDVALTPVNSVAATFVTYSKTPGAGTGTWSGNDPMVEELTSTSNLQFRVDVVDPGDTVWWQVIEFTDPSAIQVQKGSASLTAGATSTTASIASVDLTRAFVLVTTRNNSPANDVGSGLVRARLTGATTVTFDRSASAYDVDEIAWQVVELKDGSTVQHGTSSVASGTASVVEPITAVPLGRSSAFASTQTGGGQNGGRSSYSADDIIGVACFTLALTSTTQLTLTRANTAAAADVAWFVVSWGLP